MTMAEEFSLLMEYDPPTFLAYEVDTVNGRFAEAASDFGAQAVLFVRPSPILDYVIERVKQFPAVWCTTIDDDTSVAGLSGELKEMLDNVKWWSDHELLTSLTTPMPPELKLGPKGVRMNSASWAASAARPAA